MTGVQFTEGQLAYLARMRRASERRRRAEVIVEAMLADAEASASTATVRRILRGEPTGWDRVRLRVRRWVNR
jgi:hypothetical protein